MPSDLMAQVVRERKTEERVRGMETAEVVEWIHGLEDREAALVRRVERLEEALRECVSDLEMWQASYGLEDTTQAVLLDARAALAENPSEGVE